MNRKELSIGAVDLFCGIGGLTYGLQKCNINVVAGVDVDATCKFAYEKNNKSKFINKSVNEIKGTEVKELLDEYDIKVLVGCAPCQPFSNHQKNKKNRKNHKDWSLLYQFARIVNESRPDIISMENVPQLLKEQVFLDFIDSLDKLNYYVMYKVVNVADYGVAQNRRRLILIASKFGIPKMIKSTQTDKVSVKDIIGNLPKVSAGETSVFDKLHVSSSLSDINIKRIKASKQNGTWKDWPDELLLECHKKQSGKSYSSVYGRMSWDGLAPTITTQFTGYGTGRFGHPDQNRALTLREGALLQSFPKDYVFIREDEKVVKKSISRQIGNAVPPRLGEIIGTIIIKNINENRR